MYNRVILMGRLVADPELRQTPNGIPVCSFSIAVNRRYTGKDKERQADFFNVVAWRTTAEFISRFFTKGRSILVEGTLQSRNYEDKQGQKRTAIEVVVDNAYFTPEPKSGGGGGYSVPPPSAYDAPPAYGGGQSGSYGGGQSGGASYSSGSSDDFSQAPLDSEDFPF